MWLIKILVGKRPMAMNLHLMRGLYLYHSKLGFYDNVHIDYYKGKLVQCAFYMHYVQPAGIIEKAPVD